VRVQKGCGRIPRPKSVRQGAELPDHHCPRPGSRTEPRSPGKAACPRGPRGLRALPRQRAQPSGVFQLRTPLTTLTLRGGNIFGAGAGARLRTARHVSTGTCSDAAFPAAGPIVFIGFFLYLTINDTFESKDSCKEFPLKGKDWFHVQRRLPQKPAVSNKDFKVMSYPCNARNL